MNRLDWDNGTDVFSTLSTEDTYRHIPIAVFLGLIGIIGLIGNLIVCYIYGHVYTQSNSRIFLLCLAGICLFTCVFNIPLEAMNVLNQYEFSEPYLCKLSRTGNTLTTLYGSGILLAIAIDRYRKICRPLGWQITNKIAKILCVVLFFSTLCLTWPAFILYGVKSTRFKYGTVRECSVDDEFKDSYYPAIFNLIMLLFFIIALSILIVLYSLIGRKVRFFAYKNERRRSQSNTMDSEDDSEPNTNRIVQHLRRTMKGKKSKENQYVDVTPNKNNGFTATDAVNNSEITADSKSVDSCDNKVDAATDKRFAFKHQASATQLDQIRRKRKLARNTTYLMFIITSAFIIACLPYLVLVILDNVSDIVENMDSGAKAIYRFFLRSYFLNAAVNPIIYSIFDRKFRYSCKSEIRKVKSNLCRKEVHDVN